MTGARVLPPPNWGIVFAWIFRRVRRLRVSGESMAPTFGAGDTVWVHTRTFLRRDPVVGDVVVAHHPFVRDQLLIKRVASVLSDGSLELRGDNRESSTDSGGLGSFPRNAILGCVLARSPGAIRRETRSNRS